MFFLLTFLFAMCGSRADSPMSPWGYVQNSCVGAELEMAAYSLRMARKHLGMGVDCMSGE